MSNPNNEPPPGQGDPSLPAIAAARAALAHAAAAPGGPALRSAESNIMANRSASPPASQPAPRTARRPPPLALGDKKDGTGGSLSGAYPLPANCNFVPGGVEIRPASLIAQEAAGGTGEGMVHLGKHCATGATTATSTRRGDLTVDTAIPSDGGPAPIVQRALRADATLRKFALISAQSATPGAVPGYRLPSLSHLAHAALVHPLTAVPKSGAAEWAESMILEYLDGRHEALSSRTLERAAPGNADFELTRDPATGQPLPGLEEASLNAATLLQEAVRAAWIEEEAATGRTPTHTSKVRDTPPSEALTLPPPSLSGLLKALWRGQRGENLLGTDSSDKCTPVGAYEGGPCGHVFQRGDIAWNCRTCQSDATCVLCEQCFRESDHAGHEVFFHRTTPGGCCDCGDAEAWDCRGMCARHRPPEGEDGGEDKEEEGTAGDAEDDFEAVRAARRARAEHERHVDGVPAAVPGNAAPRPLPPRLAAALAAVVGSVVQSVLAAADGAAAGADASQWRLRWADEICRIWNGAADDEGYYRRAAALRALAAEGTSAPGASPGEAQELAREDLWAHPRHVLDSRDAHYRDELPPNCRLSLRLHNDDVHTFDDVIAALHRRSREPVAVPAGGAGSAGQIGGAGLTGAELRKLGEGGDGAGSDDAPHELHEGVAGGAAEAPHRRSRSPARSDMDLSPRRRPRSGGASSPTWNRSPVRTNALDAQLPGMPFAAEVDPSAPLVPRSGDAAELTKKVDLHGHVTVRSYATLDGAGVGFARLRAGAGLHCSVATAAQAESEGRAAALLEWLGGLVGSHPAVGAMVVQALVDVTEGKDALCCEDEEGATGVVPGMSRGVAVWAAPRTLPCWSGTHQAWWTGSGAEGGGAPAWRRRMEAFPPHLESSFLTKEEGRELFRRGMTSKFADRFVAATGADPDFYADVPYRLPDPRLIKSPHALWGTLPASRLAPEDGLPAAATDECAHPLLAALANGTAANGAPSVHLRQPVVVLDTDLRKHAAAEALTAALFPHRLGGLHLVGGTALVDALGSANSHFFDQQSTGAAAAADARKVAACASFAAPASPLLLLLLLDPYAPKQIRGGTHRLFLSLLTDGRFKSRFAAALGGIAHRPTSTLFCAGVGTEADTPLGFTVQLFTTGSLVKALGNLDATRALLCREDGAGGDDAGAAHVSALPIAHSVVRSVHATLLGATNDASSALHDGAELPAWLYQPGAEHPLSARLPPAADDAFLDARCTKHKRLPHLLRDLEYVFETPGTAARLLRTGRGAGGGASTPSASPTHADRAGGGVARGAAGAANPDGLPAATDALTPAPSFTAGGSSSLATYRITNALDFPAVWARLLRCGQGIDLQKRKISGGHVEFEDERWLGAYGLSLNLGGAGDALAEGPFSGANLAVGDLKAQREAMGGLFAALFREIKMWLYREGVSDSATARPARDAGEGEALQRSTLHLARSQLDESSVARVAAATGLAAAPSCDVACERGVRNLPEAKLVLLEAALLHERTRLAQSAEVHGAASSHGPVMGDWLKVPHAPLAGDGFSFHLPLHRSLARSILCACAAVVSDDARRANPDGWWRLPLLDDDDDFASGREEAGIVFQPDALSALVRPAHRSSNFRVVWSSGPECAPPDAALRRSRARRLSALLASAKVVHSLCDHPLRCLAAAQQIDHHMWARNGGGAAGMALNYGCVPLCRSLRDLDVVLVQLSASGFNVGLGARRVFSLLANRFSLDGYLCDPDRRSHFGRRGWARPPRMQEPEHAEVLAEAFFTTLCVLASDLPGPPPTAPGDDSALRRNLKRELLHALAVEPRSHSEALSAASVAVSRRDESDGGAVGAGGGASSFRAVFAEVLRGIGQPRNQGARATGPPMFQLRPEESHEYDPSFYHLRKTEHQHAMDNVARLRRQKLAAESKSQGGGAASAMVLPLVATPPVAHPRFVPSRLLLHLPSTYAAIRRYLMYVLFNGSWLPPSKPEPETSPLVVSVGGAGDVAAVPGASAEDFKRSVSSVSNRSTVSATPNNNAFSGPPAFSPETVAASSKSFLEVLHILTLQAHTLEQCSTLHGALPFLDHEQKALSSSIDVNSYLAQLVAVPDSLLDVWAFRPAPDGPLPSAGSGENRGSVLGLLVALYEHRDNAKSAGANQKSASDDHGGARVLSADGLKWLLRLVGALADGAGSMEVAYESAKSGVPVNASSLGEAGIVELDVRDQVKRMLANLPDLWPGNDVDSTSDANSASAASEKSREAQRAAKARALAKMKKMQSSFAATIHSQFNDDSEKKLVEDASEENLCIICKCDDADGDNGPMGYLGHVQRSRVAQLASKSMLRCAAGCGGSGGLELDNIYRVVGDKGCQLRSTESIESAPVAFLPRGSIVEAVQSTATSPLGLLSRRILVRHVVPEGGQKEGTDQQIVQGWASIQSSQGYIILSPLSSLCYTNTRWGPTRPVVRQCGHAAHLKCVEAHCLSLHQRSAGNQPFDGRFSANIDDGEFLCPLCKQLSNIVIPEDGPSGAAGNAAPLPMREEHEGFEVLKSESASSPADISLIRNVLVKKSPVSYSDASSKATAEFGANLSQAMQLSGDGIWNAKMKKEREFWHPALRRWDFEDDDQGSSPQIGSVLRLMRQQLIAWAAVGHSAAAAEASGRGARTEMFGEVTYSSTDPWSNYATKVKDSHPMLLDLRRLLTATASLFDAMTFEAGRQLGTNDEKAKGETAPIFGQLISDILEGQYWIVNSSASTSSNDEWRVMTSIVASMVCHVSKEDTVAPRLEARAVAAAMWTVTGSTPPPSAASGSGSMNLDSSPEVEVNDAGTVNVGNQDMAGMSNNPASDDVAPSQPRPVLPSKPLSVYRVERNLALELDPKWGTLDPFKAESLGLFRPAVASAFLYVPLLAWDLNILAGAVFSSLLSNVKANPSVTCSELHQAAKVLLVGRLVQVLATGGFSIGSGQEDDDYDDFDEDKGWDDAKKQKEATAVKELMSFCRQTLTGATSQDTQVSDDASLLENVGNALLPYGRTLVLLLRASSSAIRQRRRRSTKSDPPGPTLADTAVAQMVEDPNTMAIDDGFQLLEVIGAPLPSSIVKEDGSHSSWISLATRWLTSLVGFETYSGTHGNGLAFDNETKTWAPVSHSASADQRMRSIQNLHVETSAAAVEVEVAHLPPQREGANPEGDDADVDFEAGSEDLSSSESNEDEVMEIADEALAAQSDEELENVDMDVDFDDADFDDPAIGAAAPMMMQDEQDLDADDASDANAALSEPDGSKIPGPSDRMFSYVSRSAIIPYQPSILGISQVGPGPRGARGELFEYSIANRVMRDLSHLGSVHVAGAPLSCLAKLPKSFVELYSMVNRVKGMDSRSDDDDSGIEETAICLLTGAVMPSGRRNKGRNRPGTCTLHARKVGSGIGVFFLVQKCTVLLMHNNKSAYSPSLYVDEHGEEDVSLRRGRPLYFSEERYQALETLWRTHGIPREVAQIRSTSDRVIRDNWY